MKIAYLILTHHKFYQFRWLWNAVYSPDDVFCIHVDAKATDEHFRSVSELIGRHPNVILLPRHSVAWAGWSVVSVQLAAMRELCTASHDWDYWINLSGQDYPLQSRQTIHDTLSTSDSNFVEAWTHDEFVKQDANDPHLRMRAYIELGGKIRNLRVRLPMPRELRYKGSTWHMLRREFVEWILTSDLTQRASRHIRFQYCPDEIFFQALLMNSPFRDTRRDYRRFIKWPGPKILDQSDDADMLKATDCLFGRKFDAQVDATILHRLAARCGYDAPVEPSPATTPRNS